MTKKAASNVAQGVLWRFSFILTCFAIFIRVRILKGACQLYKEYCHLHDYIDQILL